MADTDMTNLKLASAGEVVKIWDSHTYKLCNQVSSKSLSLFHNVHWSNDGSQLVSVPVEGDKILISSLKANLSNHVELPMKGCTIAKFTSTSNRFLGIGTKDGSAMTWDLKYKKPRNVFGCRKSEVTCLQFNYKDTNLACGHADGSLVLYSTATGQSASLIYNDIEKITDLHFSFAKKSFLGCCSQDGSVALWDANTRQILKRLSEHKAPATGIRFSPTNSLLFLSVGLDKNIHFYCTKARELVRTIQCDSPLCSVDFKDDGVTITVGCSRGRIYFYDLRYPTGVSQHTLHAHTTSVQSLAFQSFTLNKEKALKSETFRYEANSIYDPLKCIENASPAEFSLRQSTSEFNKNAMMQGKQSLTYDLFSPIRESFRDSYVNGNEFSRNVKNSTICEANKFSFAFSPLQNHTAPESSAKFGIPENIFGIKESDISTVSNTQKSQTSVIDPSRNIDITPPKNEFSVNGEGKSLKQQLFKAALSPQSALGMCSRSGDCAREASWSCGVSEKPISPKTVHDAEIVLEQPKLLENSVPNDIVPHKLELPTLDYDNLENSSNCKTADLLPLEMSDIGIDEGKGTSTSNTPMTPQGFQAEFFKQLLVDAMEEQTDVIRQSFQRLHVQMIREFEEQRHEVEKMLKKYSHQSLRNHERRFQDGF